MSIIIFGIREQKNVATIAQRNVIIRGMTIKGTNKPVVPLSKPPGIISNTKATTAVFATTKKAVIILMCFLE